MTVNVLPEKSKGPKRGGNRKGGRHYPVKISTECVTEKAEEKSKVKLSGGGGKIQESFILGTWGGHKPAVRNSERSYSIPGSPEKNGFCVAAGSLLGGNKETEAIKDARPSLPEKKK